MADRGVATTLPAPEISGAVTGYAFSSLFQGAVAALGAPEISPASTYRLAGTTKTGPGTVVPVIGQLWPRGSF